MVSMNPISFPGPPPGEAPWLPPDLAPSSAFWESSNLVNRLTDLHASLNLAKAMKEELEILRSIKDEKRTPEDRSSLGFARCLENKGIDVETQELASISAASALMSRLRAQLEPFRRVFSDGNVPWEEKSAAVRLAERRLKSKRNKLWRKRKRRRVAEWRAEERERFERADREADEWRAREIAKDVAQQKVQKMKEIAKLKAKEERKRLESELELVMIVEKLRELRSIRIEKMKKQGHFLPEEDDKFLDNVRAAVEEEERQAIAAADTEAAKGAIATAEESRQTNQTRELVCKESGKSSGVNGDSGTEVSTDQISENMDGGSSEAVTRLTEEKQSQGFDYGRAYETLASLPMEFYHYYHGSNNDMGTLIEVRRTWDAYIRPGGSRIPGHWVQPPPPASDVWASYLVRPKR